MRTVRLVMLVMAACMLVGLVRSASAQSKVQTLEPKPMDQVVQVRLKPISTAGALRVPLITWGGDVATILADSDGLFKQQGLDVKLFVENDFAKQVQGFLDGETPLLRGTMGMINAAMPAVKAAGTDLVVVYQMTWSAGGDTMTVREDVRRPEDLKGKAIALQLYGPHMDYVANLVTSAGMKPTDVQFRWFKELTLPTYNTGGAIVDPVSAFAADPKLNAVMCISPDAMNLTSKGKVGTGAEGSVKGARILLSTKTASRIIADVYAVRRDYFEANRAKVQQFVQVLLRAEEALRELRAEKTPSPRSRQLLAKSAELLFGSAQATGDVEGLLGDCEFVGHPGNVAFFTGLGTTRSLATLTTEIQAAFQSMGLMSGKVPLRPAEWDYEALAKGLKNATRVEAKPAVGAGMVETTEFADLFLLEIYFDPNQSTFAQEKYAKSFDQALKISQTYGGAVVVIEGHSDPLGVLRARQQGVSDAELAQMEQSAKNLSLMRANAVKQAYLEYCKAQKIAAEESQFVPVGAGVKSPKFNPPKTKEEWSANRRVVFRIKQVETELTDFPAPK